MVIFNMRQKKPAYNLISNNCQNFAMALLDHIQTGSHIKFATTMDVYQRATGKGTIKDLFLENPPEEETDTEPAKAEHQSALDHAQQVMDENTTKLDTHHTLH